MVDEASLDKCEVLSGHLRVVELYEQQVVHVEVDEEASMRRRHVRLEAKRRRAPLSII